MNAYRQGDVSIMAVNSVPKQARKVMGCARDAGQVAGPRRF